MKNILGVLLLAIFFFIIPTATLASEVEDGLDKLLFAELRLSAVIIEMDMYLGWFPNDKESLREASEVARGNLDEIKKYIADIPLPEELVGLKKLQLGVTERLGEVYTGIEAKGASDIMGEVASIRALHWRFREKLNGAVIHYRQALPKDFDYSQEESKLIQNEEDAKEYAEALLCIAKKGYKKAYEKLDRLREKYAQSTFADCLLLKMSDCLLMAESDIKEERLEAAIEGIEILTGIVNRGRYSPVLYEAFRKWRTSLQYFYLGTSNIDEIPNEEYNKRRWEIVQTIKSHLRDNPADVWAKEQIALLLDLANIERGDPYGPVVNSTMNDWRTLYSGVLTAG